MTVRLLLQMPSGLWLRPLGAEAGHAAAYHDGLAFDSRAEADDWLAKNLKGTSLAEGVSMLTAQLPSWAAVPGSLEYIHLGVSEDLALADSTARTTRTADAWLQAYQELEILLDPRLQSVLRSLNGAAPNFSEEEASHEGMFGIRQLALKTPTLPPAEHTNTWIVGHERLMFVDPAAYDEGERERLAGEVERLRALGQKPMAIALTHHHPDHMGAAMWLAARYQLPIWAHPLTAELLRGQVTVDRLVNEGDTIALGQDGAGQSFDLSVLHTPGHAPGHLVFVDERPGARAMIVGDMVAAVGSILVDPSDGDMAQYIHQLERMASRGESVLMPAHGPPIGLGERKLRGYVEHRLLREAKVERALAARQRATPDELLFEAYADTPVQLHPLARRACWSHLLKLVAEGRAEQVSKECFRKTT